MYRFYLELYIFIENHLQLTHKAFIFKVFLGYINKNCFQYLLKFIPLYYQFINFEIDDPYKLFYFNLSIIIISFYIIIFAHLLLSINLIIFQQSKIIIIKF